MKANNQSEKEYKKIDWMITLLPLGIIIALCVLFFCMPEQSNAVLSQIRFVLGDTFGTYYLIIGLGVFLISFYVAGSKYGNIVLGGQDEKPKFSFFAWGSMMFTAGAGSRYFILFLFRMDSVCNGSAYCRAWKYPGLGKRVSDLSLESDSVGILSGTCGCVWIYASCAKERETEVFRSMPPDSGKTYRWLGRKNY